MVDAIVTLAIQKLEAFLSQKIVVLQNVRGDVEWLRNEFGYMRSFLMDAEEKQGSDQRVQHWISEITNMAYDTTSILEDFALKIEGSVEPTRFLDRLHFCVCTCRKQVDKYNIGVEIESIKQRLLDISRKREIYGITNIGSNSLVPCRGSIAKALRRATSYVDDGENNFVGYEDVIDILVKEILKDEPQRTSLSILGMGGLGKTTVARTLYNSPQLSNEFHHRAWVCVSQEYSIPDLLRTIIKSFKKGVSREELEFLEKMDAEDLERELRKALKDQRYLIVVDDVWHKEAWQSLKRAFPDCKNGSRVIITTRKKDVARRTEDKCFVHELRFLTPDESWDLFCKRLSCNDDYNNWCSFAMLDLGKKMVDKCGGLPLAIIVLGGLLAHKTSLHEWQKVKDHLWRCMKNESIEISPLLSLSFNDLPSEMKQCFLYLGVFPEDYLISAEKLMWFWMAEGLIQGQEEPEDIAEDYLNQLIDRCLIQVAKRFWGKTFKIKIHDLIRDLVVEKAMEVRFFDIYDPDKSSTQYSSRRCAIHKDLDKFSSISFPNQMLRSILNFNPGEYDGVARVLTPIFQNFRHLYLLNIDDSFGYQVLPECIGNLIHLRYLGLTNVNELPKSVGNLKSLLVLEAMLHDRVSCRVPPQLSQLVNLKHILCRMDGHVKLGTLINLRSLRYVNVNVWMQTDTTNLINLQELAIEKIDQSTKLDSIGMLKNLGTLFLHCSYSKCFPSLQPLLQCQCRLKLWLDGKIDNVLSLGHLPQSVTNLTLFHSHFEDDPMPLLEKLQNLRNLDMNNCFNGKEMVCAAKGFPQLEFLYIYGLRELERWQVHNQALLVIRGFGIYECPQLKMIPERLQSTSVLKILEHKYNYDIRQPILNYF